MKLLVTGGAGFIGSNFIHYWLREHPKDEIVNLDKLTYAGNLENLKDVEKDARYAFIKGDIAKTEDVEKAMEGADVVVNFAAESHNSYAVLNPGIFFRTNVLGTQTLLEASRKVGVKRFHHISTCEVYGDLPLDSPEKFTEESPYRPRTPYNASKAGADLAVRAYFETFRLPVTISNACNNYGPYQFPEKLIPLFITNLLENKEIPIYKESQNRREWVHVLDHCRAIELVLQKGKLGETYNVGSGIEKSIGEIAEILLKELDKPENLKKYVPDRPGHDRRYLLDSSKIEKELGWKPEIDFDTGIKETIQWYKERGEWWRPLKAKLQVQEEEWKSGA